MARSTEPVLVTARFDPKLRTYLYLNSLFMLVVTVIGLPFIPIWLFLGWWWSGRYFRSIRCEMTERRLRVERGVLFRSQKTIPLDKIQDFSLRHGPLLRAFGLCTLRIETAGQSAAQGGADAGLTGLVDAEAFQEQVLAQRDRHVAGYQPAVLPAPEPLPESAATVSVLTEIRDVLMRLERRLAERPPV